MINCPESCPVTLSTDCVYYVGANLVYTGINTNDTVTTVVTKLESIVASGTINSVIVHENTYNHNLIASAVQGLPPTAFIDGRILLFDGDSGTVIKSGPVPGTAILFDATAFADYMQGLKADTAIQGDTPVTDGQVAIFSNSGTTITSGGVLGTAAFQNITAFATAAQGTKADTALQNISGQDLSTADNTTSAFITLAQVPPSAVLSVNGLNGVVVLTKSHVGLSNVDNTSDANKPISTATQIALNNKVDSSTFTTHTNDLSIHYPQTSINHINIIGKGTNTHAQIDSHIASVSNPHSVTKSQVGLGNADNTSDLAKPISTATQAALDTKSSIIRTISDKTNDYVVVDTDDIIFIDGSANTVDITLFTAVGADSKPLTLKCIDDTFACNIITNASEEIDGDSSNFQIFADETLIIIPHNGNWWTI